MDFKQREDFALNKTEIIDGNRIKIGLIKSNKYLIIDPTQIDLVEQLINDVTANNISIKDKVLVIEVYRNAYMTTQQCEKLIKFREVLTQNGCEVKVHDGDLWELDDVIRANSQLDNAVNKIKSTTINENGKSRPLNEMEKFLMAYKFVTNRKFKDNLQNADSPRSITSILKTGDVVCVGFATLLKEMCNRLDIECYVNHCQVQDAVGQGGHQNNVVVINGNPYYCDACWDCVKADGQNTHLNHCLIPCDDIYSFNGTSISKSDAPYMDMELDRKNAIEAIEKLKTINEETYFEVATQTWFNRYVNIIYKDQKKPDFTNPFIKPSYEEVVEYIEKIIKQIDSHSNISPITIDQIETTLKNLYEANGHNRAEAVEKVGQIIQSNITNAGINFTSEATNCFAQEYNKSLVL